MATKKKQTTRSKKAQSIPGIWQSLSGLNYAGTLWRVVVFIGIWLAVTALSIVKGADNTRFMAAILEGLLLFALAFALYDSILVAIIRRYKWHARADKVMLLGFEATIALWFLLAGALSQPAFLTGGDLQFQESLGSFFEQSLFWVLLVVAFWPPIRAFIGISHMAITRKK